MDPELMSALAIDKVTSLGLLIIAVVAIWRSYKAAIERLISALQGQTAELKQALDDVKTGVAKGFAGLTGRVDDHQRRLDDHQRRLDEQGRRIDRHAELVGALSAASGVYSRARVAEEVPRD